MKSPDNRVPGVFLHGDHEFVISFSISRTSEPQLAILAQFLVFFLHISHRVLEISKIQECHWIPR
jgi:hypothetical protein